MIYTLLGATLALVVYVENNRNLSQLKESEKTIDLAIPDDADQATTRSVNLSITSPVAARMATYTDESCTDTSLLTELPVSEVAKNIRLDVVRADRALYVWYATSKGKEMMNIPPNATSTRAETLAKLPEDVGGFDINRGEDAHRCQWYFAKGETATLMMENGWPEMRDCDFNDFVTQYYAQAIFFNNDNRSEDLCEVDEVGFEITFHAMGGYLPYRLGLQLDQASAKHIDEVIKINGNDLVRMELQNPGEDAPAIFVLTGTDQLRKQNSGGTLYSIGADHQIAANDLVTIRYRLRINCFDSLERTKALWTTAISGNQSFFLQKERNGEREIRLRGYGPTAYHSDSYASEVGNDMCSDIKYCSTGNFMWGIKVPIKFAHPREKKDIMGIYGKFRSRVTNPNLSSDSPDFSENWFGYLDSS